MIYQRSKKRYNGVIGDVPFNFQRTIDKNGVKNPLSSKFVPKDWFK